MHFLLKSQRPNINQFHVETYFFKVISMDEKQMPYMKTSTTDEK